MNFTYEIVSIEKLGENGIGCMYRLMQCYYDNIPRDKFMKDLYAKEGVLLCRDEKDEICGFTTYTVFETYFNEEKIKVLFSGDTIIREEFWGQWGTVKSFISLIRRFLNEDNRKCYWFLLTKGVRTYRCLPLYFKKYYPSFQLPTPQYEQQLIVHLSRLKFGDYYLENEGVVRLCADRLKERYLSVKENKFDDPFIQFFMKKNPGYAIGDELPCLARISKENLTTVSRRWLTL